MSSLGLPTETLVRSDANSKKYLYGPTIDFFLLGGGSLLALLALHLYLGSSREAQTTSLTATLALANIINHPHFAHSYQIFYRGYRSKLLAPAYAPDLRLRYFLAGIVAPIAIASFLVWTVLSEHPRMLGLAANAMFFLVGWHYVKQGYGMAMVDAALKKAYYDSNQKRALLVNGYCAWILSWLLINHLVSGQETLYFEIQYFAVPVPLPLLFLAGAATVTSTAWLGIALWLRLRAGNAIAWNGLLGYAASLYVWLLIRDPVVLLWVPLFHSLQYLAVVWKFQNNVIKSNRVANVSPRIRMVAFLASGFILGYLGFWAAPEWLSANTPYNREIFGSSLYFFLFWIFINIHHYFLDTVMWRKGNPDVARYLFDANRR